MANANASEDLNGCHLCPEAASTRGLAVRLARGLPGAVVVALDGPLGSGKTEFVKGLAEGLECTDIPTSPTFAVAHEYGGGRLPLFHFDFYRLENEAEVETSGFEECLGSGVVAVEWAEKFPAWLPSGTIRVRMEFHGERGRKVTIS